MSQSEEWDWPPPRTYQRERVVALRRHWSASKGYTLLANGFFTIIVGFYKIALATALGGLVVGCLWLLSAVLKA